MLRQAVNLAPLGKDDVPVQQQAEAEDDGAWQEDSAGPAETWQVSGHNSCHSISCIDLACNRAELVMSLPSPTNWGFAVYPTC